MEEMDGRHHALDMVRGLAAVGVAVYHFLAWNEVAHIQSMGTFSVYLFFVLSALTMMMVYAERFKGAIELVEVKSFYLNRMARILPLLAGVAAVKLLIMGPTVENFSKAGLTASALFSLHLPAFLSNSVGAWSLGIEGMFYVVFPIAALLAGSSTLRNLIWATVTLIMAQQAVLYLLQPIPDSFFFQYYTTPLMFAPFFAAGFVIHRLGDQRRLEMFPVTLALLAVIMSFSVMVNVPLFRNQGTYLMLTGMSILVILFAYRSAVPAKLTRVAGFLGNISYALYLTHWMPAGVWRRLTPELGLSAPLHFALYTTSAVILAAVTYQWFERPARNFIRRRHVSKSAASASVAAP